MEDTVQEALFETRRHASRPFYSNYPPQQQINEDGSRGSLLSFLPFRGIIQLREKWSDYKQPRRPRRLASLFVSEEGDYVAVASRNQITILQKDDDYQEPVGIFHCGSAGTFTCGTWSESHELLGVVDDMNTIYIIKPNGEEITRISKRHLHITLPIVGLIVKDDTYEKSSPLCSFTIFLLDGSFHDIEISKDPSASIFSAQALNNTSMLRRLQDVYCCYCCPKLSLLAVVSSTGDIQSTSNKSSGSCTLSLWRREKNLQMEPLVFSNFEGSYSIPEIYHAQLTYPKILFSPHRKFIATLDTEGCLFTFKFDQKSCSLSKFFVGESHNLKVMTETSSSGAEFFPDVADFTWWTDDIVMVAKRNGTIAMVGILSFVTAPEEDSVYSMPILERTKHYPGLVFLLDITSREDSFRSSDAKGASLFENVTLGRPNQFDVSKLEWSLVSLVKRSVFEIYDKMINDHKYQSAVDFADSHGLDKDKVLKSQWLSSIQGVHEINTILSTIKDQVFILSQCVDKVGPTEDAVRTLLSFGLRITDFYRFSESEDNECRQTWEFRLVRLKLLQFRDRLETFLGINMGRFSMQEYDRFRDLPIIKVALVLAESGKIGALNLLFKRHPYSLIPSILEVLAAIPETIPIQSYAQLLPGISAPSTIVLRDEDWVECEKMVSFINMSHSKHETIQIMTEPILMKYATFQWPSISELSSWYKKRAREIDEFSGQIDSCMHLVDFAIDKGIPELQQFRGDIFYLQQLIYSDEIEDERNFSMSLAAWEQLPDYEKFKLMLMGVREDNVISRLDKMALPFLHKVLSLNTFSEDEGPSGCLVLDRDVDLFLDRWLKEIAAQNKLELCLIIVEEACRGFENNQFFKNETQLVGCSLECIYLCTDVNRWSTMSAILSKLPQMRDLAGDDIKQRLELAEGHVEAGRLLAYYQVPKPISFFLDGSIDGKSAKQIIRLALSKFTRSQPGRTDHDWANMWRDLQSLQQKAFPFLDLEYMLIEFCRALLKAGKFSLARNYLKGTSSVALGTEKGENLVIQAAREYFYSAPSLSCPEIWKAKECLNIFPGSRIVRVEADVIDAVTVRLPNLGVNLLPMAFRQIKDPMEIIKLAVTGKTGAYLNVDDLIEIAKLLGLSAQEDISNVQELIAREAAFSGDVQLAFDLCLVLAKKGHGSVWDLCAAIARSQVLESMDSKSQKLLLGFALSHCDEESIGELLHEWKDLDMQDRCETLITLTRREPSEFSEQVSSYSGSFSGTVDVSFEDQEAQFAKVKNFISMMAENIFSENGLDWESFFREKGKLVSFAASWLPFLHELSEEAEFGKKIASDSVSSYQNVSTRTRAVATILSWLTRNDFTPRDDLIASLAKSIMEPPVSDVDDVIGCSILLNLIDAVRGVEIIEEQLSFRGSYYEFSSLMNMGMIYSLLHNYGMKCENPSQRRELLMSKFKERHKSLNSDEWNNVHEAQSTFWNEWRVKLEQQKHLADESRVLEKIIPGVETSRFFSGDMDYIQGSMFSLIDSVKLEKKHILKDALILAHTYGLDHNKMLLYYLGTILVSEFWSVDDIMEEVSHFREEILASAGEAIKVITLSVYPALDGRDKQRLAFIYSLLSDCYLRLQESLELPSAIERNQPSAFGLAHFCKIVEQECTKVSFIKDLNFKNIAGLQDLNLGCLNSEVCSQIDENNLDVLATMVQNLAHIYGDTAPEGLLSWKYVYVHYISSSLATLEAIAERETHFQSSEDLLIFINEIELTYDACGKHIRFVEHPGVLDIVKRFFTAIFPAHKKIWNFPFDSTGKVCLIKLINFWLRLMNDVEKLVPSDISGQRFCSKCLAMCLEVFLSLLDKEMVSPNIGWATVLNYVGYGVICNVAVEIFNFCRAMIFGGCEFESIDRLFTEVVAQLPPGSELTETAPKSFLNVRDLPNLYLSILETILQELTIGSSENRSLHYLLSSLSKLKGDLGNLRNVRLAVWDRLSIFSYNLQLPSHLRVHALVLMQFISGREKNLELRSFEWPAYLLPWVGWDGMQDRTANPENSADEPNAKDVSITLVALKSSQLVATISPNLDIVPEDILSVDSAVSCFVRVSESATTALHVNALLDVLAELDGLFTTQIDEGASAEVADAADNWSNNDWDEGWESFQDESTDKETERSNTLSIHPLHICWLTITRKMIMLSSHNDLLRLLDQNSTKSQVVLLDEDDTRNLTETAREVDCILALKLALMLPYKAIQLQCLDVVENKLKGGIPDNFTRDHFFFVLVLSSGILSTIITKTSYGTTFSFLCYMVGDFCHRYQETRSTSTRHDGIILGEKNKENFDSLFVKILFPWFLSELVKADQSFLAGMIVTRFMNTNASLSLINISDACLRTYLGRELQEWESTWEQTSSCDPLSNTIAGLGSKLGNLIQSALSLLPT
ncbi:MAG2-interacting protein 2 isoform X1 [Primulina huaijiensis]|uniref:MAG2-interacting protein 2 isoform X1 n=2 Tax=Primulina huaijiensis TaxID=1492673 RepID=UPI003CC6E963